MAAWPIRFSKGAMPGERPHLPDVQTKDDTMRLCEKEKHPERAKNQGTDCNTMTKKTKSHVPFASITLANLVTPLVQILKTRTCLSRVASTLD
jgi:hypothetical protein